LATHEPGQHFIDLVSGNSADSGLRDLQKKVEALPHTLSGKRGQKEDGNCCEERSP
jgi:hypothetical protein